MLGITNENKMYDFQMCSRQSSKVEHTIMTIILFTGYYLYP